MKKTALITGGARRVGKEIALNLAKQGYWICITYNTSEQEAEQTKRQLEENGARCSLFKCSFSENKETEGLIREVLNKAGSLDVLINNASVFQRSTIEETSPDDLEHIFRINFFAPYILSRNFYRLCKKGTIINLLDAKVTKNDFLYSAYTLSKQALQNLTLQSALEFAPAMRVNGICPGIVLPPDNIQSQHLPDPATKIPLQKMGSVQDVLSSVDFLLTNDYITGQVIFLDGGMHLM